MDLLSLALRFLLTLGLGAAGGAAAKKLHIPAAFMVGAMITVMVVNLTTGFLYFPADFRIVMQIMAGAMVGSKISRKDIGELRRLIIPCVWMVIYFSIFMVFNGLVLWRYCGMDLVSALFGSAPGGMTDTALISADFGANVALVTVMQLVRLVSVLLSYPLIFRYMAKRGMIKPHHHSEHAADSAAQTAISTAKGTLILIAAAAVPGIPLFIAHVPAGTIVGGMFGAGAVNIMVDGLRLDRRISICIQVLAGSYIGSLITRDDVRTITSSFLPVLILVSSVLVFPWVFGWLIHRLTGLELDTALFGATPGGLQEMALLAEDMGLDVPKVSIIHIVRVIASLAVFPLLVRLIMHFTVGE